MTEKKLTQDVKYCLYMSLVTEPDTSLLLGTLDSVIKNLGYFIISAAKFDHSKITSYFQEKKITGEIREASDSRTDTKASPCTYVLTMKVGEVLHGQLPSKLPSMTCPSYSLKIQDDKYTAWEPRLVHKLLQPSSVSKSEKLASACFVTTPKLVDAITNPVEERKIHRKLISEQKEQHERSESIFNALYKDALCSEMIGDEWQSVMEKYLKAYSYRPNRHEPLTRIAQHYLVEEKNYALAYGFSKWAIDISASPALDSEVQPVSMYDHRYLLREIAGVSSLNLGKPTEALEHFCTMLASHWVPHTERVKFLEYIDKALAFTREGVTSPLTGDEFGKWQQACINAESMNAISVRVKDVAGFRSVVRYTEPERLLKVEGGIELKLTGIDDMIRSNMNEVCDENKTGCDLALHVPKGYVCTQQWYPEFCLEIIKKTKAYALVLSSPPSELLMQKPCVSHDLEGIVYYEVGKKDIKDLNTVPHLRRLEGSGTKEQFLVFLAFGIFAMNDEVEDDSKNAVVEEGLSLS